MKTYELRPTSDPNLSRVVDRRGEWDTYLHRKRAHCADCVPSTEAEANDLLACKHECHGTQPLRGVTAILHRGYAKPQLMRYLAEKTPEYIEKKLHFAGEKGDAVHQFIAAVLSGAKCTRATLILSEDRVTQRPLTHDEWDCVVAFSNFWNRHKPKLIAHEFAVANLDLGYAGSGDAILRLTQCCAPEPKKPKKGSKAKAKKPTQSRREMVCGCKKVIGKAILFDWKSGNGIHDEMGAQVAAYANADLMEILQGRKLDGTAIVRLGTRHKTTGGYEVQFYDRNETRTHFREFKAAITIDDAAFKPFDLSSIVEIPDSIFITIDREAAPPVAPIAPPVVPMPPLPPMGEGDRVDA